MKACSLLVIIICCIYRYTSVEIRPELTKNILKFGYGINFKYEGMLAYSFERLYVVTKFVFSTIKDVKFSALNFHDKCEYLQEKEKEHNSEAKKQILDLITYCRKIKPYVYFYRQQITSLNQTVHHILKN